MKRGRIWAIEVYKECGESLQNPNSPFGDTPICITDVPNGSNSRPVHTIRNSTENGAPCGSPCNFMQQAPDSGLEDDSAMLSASPADASTSGSPLMQYVLVDADTSSSTDLSLCTMTPYLHPTSSPADSSPPAMGTDPSAAAAPMILSTPVT